MGKVRHKKRTHVPPMPDSQDNIPRSMVIKMGDPKRKPTKALSALVRDFRTIMQPYTAARLRERRANKLKDFFVMAGPLGVTNFFIFSQSLSGNTTVRIGRTPRGPTLYFRINKYSLSRDIQRVQARPHALTPHSAELQNPPVLVMNGFSANKTSDVDALLTSMFQNMLPTIHVDATTSLAGVRRVLLLNRVPDTGEIELRHYSVVTRVVGSSKAVKKLIAASKGQRSMPDLRNLQSVAQYMEDPTASDSEAEDEVIQPTSTGISEPTLVSKVKRAVRLVEVGPRINMSLLKVEEGLCSGRTIYHSLEQKSAKEAEQLEMKHRNRENERAARRKEQEEKLRLKREATALKGSRRKRGEERMKLKERQQNGENEESSNNQETEDSDISEHSDDEMLDDGVGSINDEYEIDADNSDDE